MKTIFVKWDTGDLTLDIEQFFPTSQARVKKLVKIVKLDWQDGEGTLEYIRCYLEGEAAQVRSKLSWMVPKFKAILYDPKEIKQINKLKKWPDGTPVQPLEKDNLKALLKWYQQLAAMT